jgi:hypothetical protein
MDSLLRGWIIGHLLGQAINRHRETQLRRGAIAYSDLSGMAWSWNHRSARAAEHTALGHYQGAHPRLWACGAEITIAVAHEPRGAFAYQGPTPAWPPTPAPAP